MQALATLRRFRNLATIVPVLALAACGQGDGPESIPNEPVTPLPPVAPGFCDPINFEPECSNPEIVNFNGGATIIVDNPDPSGINTSDRVAQMQKFPDEVFGGTLLNLDEPVDFSEGESYTVKVWSPRPVTVSFKLEEQGNPAGGLTVDEDHSGSGSWEELCFDFTGQAVPPPVVALTIIFDNGTLGQADTDPDNWTFYYDDITQVESCEVAGGPGDIRPDAALYTSDGAPDLLIPDDYAERTPFGSGSVIDPDYADDDTFSPVLSVSSGTGYGANVAQVGFIGFPEGFLTQYEIVDFKVKGMPDFVIFVKLFDGVDALRLNLTSSDYAEELTDGWFQVSIPVADFTAVGQATGIVFESDDSSETEFRMLLNDIGFSGTGTYVPADPGIIPEVTLYDRDGTPDLEFGVDYTEISTFGSAAELDDDFRGDLDFRPAWAVTTGFGYDIWNAQLAYLGFEPGFAAPYATLDFKVKDLSGDVIRVKFLDDPDPPYVDIDVTDSAYATALGNGWYQVSAPLTEFQGVDTATGLLFETISPAPAESFTYLLTDIGLSGDAPVPTPVAVDFEADPGSYSFDNFGGGESTVIANPDPGGINASGQVVQMTRSDASDFGGSTLALPEGVDWSQGETFRMKVWSRRPVPVLFKVEGTPATERSGDHSGGSVWQELCFDFTGDNAGTPVTGISVFFDLGTVGDVGNDPENWTFYYDDIEQTTEPCPTPTAVDFEGDPGSYSFADFGGGESTVIANPDASGLNTSARVVQMTRTSESDFGGSTLALPDGVDWTQGEVFRMKVWSQRVVPVLFKVEGSPPAERSDDHDGGSAWQELCFDFTGDNAGPPVTGISIFFDLGTVGDVANNPDDWTFYYDDIVQTSEPCPVAPPAPDFTTITFDDPATTYTLTDFGGTASTVTNDPAGGTNQVVLTVKSDTAEVWAGTTVSTLPGETVPVIPLDASNTEMSVRVYSPDAGIPVRLKIEDASNGAVSVETEALTTAVNTWETLTFDFASEAAGTTAFDPAAAYNKISIFFNFGTDGATAGEKTYYFDDIAVGAGPGDHGPGTAGVFTETATESTITVTSITNSIDFGGNNTVVDPDSTAIPAFEGDVVLSIDYQDSGSTFGGAVLNFGGVDLTAYDTLNFTIDTSGIAGFADLTVQIEPPGAGAAGTNVLLSSYTPVATSGNWATYAIPLADFTATTFAAVDNLGFWNPVDGGGLAFGTVYVDDIYFSTENGTGGGGSGGAELLTNGDFEASDADKAPWLNSGGIATNNFYTADAADGQQVFETNLSQVAAITQGTEYVLTFRARASVARDIIAGIGLNGAPFTAETSTVPLTTEWQSFSYNLTAVADIGTAESRVLFDMGGVTSTVNIDDVSLTPAGGGAELLTNGDFEASDADKAPWLNSGGIATNNFYTADAADGQQVFETNLSQVAAITQGTEYVLTFRARASVARDIIAGIGLNGAPFTAETATVPLTTDWQSFSYNLTAVADIGTAESRVLFDMGGLTSTVNIDDVSLTEASGGSGGGGGSAAGELTVNGGFEAGDLTGWETFDNGGTVTVTTDASGGSFAGNVNVTIPGNPTLKQSNLAAGSLTAGQQVTVSFDWKGTDANGGVVDVVLFSELSGGGVSQTDQILSGGGFPTDWTTVGPLTITLGPDVSGGVTLQFTAICGGAAGCVSDVFVDNVSVVAD